MDLVFFLGFVIIKFRCGPQVMLIVSVNWFRLLPTLLSKTDHVKFQVSSPLGEFFNLLLLWNLNLIFNLLTFQGDEVTLAKAINLLHMNKDDYITILFYAVVCSKVNITSLHLYLVDADSQRSTLLQKRCSVVKISRIIQSMLSPGSWPHSIKWLSHKQNMK
jgi:hypothetical protein